MSAQPTGPQEIRLGYHDRANLMPLLYPLRAGWVVPDSPWRLEVINMPPGALVSELLEGQLDAAFLPPLAVTNESKRLAPLGGWGLASEAASTTALILSPQRLDNMDEGHLLVTPEASGSAAEHLVRILLKPYYDISLTLHRPGDSDAQQEEKWARLLYSDQAAIEAQRKPEGWVAEDLGVAWYVLSGLPLVWEMLAVQRDLNSRKPGAQEALQSALKRSQRTAQEQQLSIHDEAARRMGLKREAVKDIFSRQRYTLGDHEQKGLAHFFTLASQAGIMNK